MERILKSTKTHFVFLLAVLLFLIGCGRTENPVESAERENITYSREDVVGKITDLDMRHWYDQTDKYEWRIVVKCEDLTMINDGAIEGYDNAPSFVNKRIGDMVELEVVTKYSDGQRVGRCISAIK